MSNLEPFTFVTLPPDQHHPNTAAAFDFFERFFIVRSEDRQRIGRTCFALYDASRHIAAAADVNGVHQLQARLEFFAVNPSVRRHGVGSGFLNKVETNIAGLGVRSVVLVPGSKTARKFFGSNGYLPDPSRVRLMAKILPPETPIVDIRGGNL